MKKNKKSKSNWLIELDKALTDEWKTHFGHNVEFDAKSYFNKIEKLGGKKTHISIKDDYTATIKLPPKSSDRRNDVLLFIVTNSPLPSECKFNNKKDSITLEWHY